MAWILIRRKQEVSKQEEMGQMEGKVGVMKNFEDGEMSHKTEYRQPLRNWKRKGHRFSLKVSRS